ncbi:hypothetical protein EI94DRAFT_1701224 [Lactarius quietus]|nr:hypothetical protein EI94DRAFT_1701224 [Lactarius quietus]
MDLLHFDILDLFRPFRNVERLCVTQASLSLVTGALRLAAGELAVVALPELREIQTENQTQLTSVEECLAPLIAARQHSTHPVAVRTQFPFGLPPLARQGAFRQRRLRTTQFLSTVQKELPDGFRFRILVLGKRQSGKSALINAVFNVDIMAGVLGSQHDDANINLAFCPYNNNYLVVHEYLGFESGDAQSLQNIREFISYYTDANRSVPARLHAVWICVPISDAIESGLDEGVKEILAIKQVPVLIVFTKFDVLVSQIQFDIARGDIQMHEDPWTRAHAIYEASCRSFFHKDPRDVPASVFSGDYSSIVGRSRYWRDLGSSSFTNHTLESCVNVIHEDIIKVWNFDDREEYLLGREFTAMMTDLVGDMARVGSSDISSPNSPDLYLNWTSTLMAPWTNGLYQNAVSATEAQSAVQNYKSGSKDQIHEDIRSFVAQTPLTYQDKDIMMEKVIDLIKQNCVRASS